MPTMNEVLERVQRIRPNAIEEKDRARWLVTLDGRAFEEVIGLDKPDKSPVKAWPDDGAKELLIGNPYDSVYDLYLTAMICFALGEYKDYNNIAEQFERTFQDFKTWWRKHHVPKNTAQIRGV